MVLPARRRWISLFETALGAFLVLGHNVWRILPNEGGPGYSNGNPLMDFIY